MFRKKFRPVYIVLNTWSFILLFKFVLWYTLFLFCVEFKIVLYQFLYRCGHFNLSLIANQTISDSFLDMCSPVKFSSDTDVLLLSLHFYSKITNIDELWFQTDSITSVKDGRRFIPVHDLYNSLGAEMANILLTGTYRFSSELWSLTTLLRSSSSS